MKTHNVTEEIETVLVQLAQQGKMPTVALVKARLKTAVPMPAIIAAIKSWKGSETVPNIEVVDSVSNDAKRLQSLESTVASLIQRIEKLEQKLNEKAHENLG